MIVILIIVKLSRKNNAEKNSTRIGIPERTISASDMVESLNVTLTNTISKANKIPTGRNVHRIDFHLTIPGQKGVWLSLDLEKNIKTDDRNQENKALYITIKIGNPKPSELRIHLFSVTKETEENR